MHVLFRKQCGPRTRIAIDTRLIGVLRSGCQTSEELFTTCYSNNKPVIQPAARLGKFAMKSTRYSDTNYNIKILGELR